MADQSLVLSPENADLLPALQHVVTAAYAYLDNQHAASTRTKYEKGIQLFAAWCDANGMVPFPASPQTIALFLTHEAERGMSASTLEQRVAALRYAHRMKETDSPTSSELVKATMKGIKRTIGTQKKAKAAATIGHIKAMVAHCPDTLGGLRDRALLLIGFAGAFRRAELAHIRIEHLEFVSEGVRIYIPKSKTDQAGKGQYVPVLEGTHLFPVAALKTWLDRAGICDGFVFRGFWKGGRPRDKGLSPYAVATIVKKYAQMIGLHVDDFSGHSLRSGFATSAAAQGKSRDDISGVTRHTKSASLDPYIQRFEAFQNHAAEGMY